MNSIRITIITVTYNAASVLEETILSVINQTYSNIEYIIIDGGSKDNTVDIIKKYQDRISFWISEPDKGIYDAMNKGIDKASGEWINFMNAGDKFHNDNVLFDVFKGNRDKFGNANVIYGNTAYLFTEYSYVAIPRPVDTIENGLFFCHQSSFVNTALMKDYKFNIKYKICADFDFFYKIYSTKESVFTYIPVVITDYFGEGGISGTSHIEVYKERNYILYGKINVFKFVRFFLRLKLAAVYRIFISKDKLLDYRIMRLSKQKGIKFIR